MLDNQKRKTLLNIANFYDKRKVGDIGSLGFRRSTDLSKLISGIDTLIYKKRLITEQSIFLDLGCADGRVNVVVSYLMKLSIGIEIDEWTLDEYLPLRKELESSLIKKRLELPPKNIFLFHGDALSISTHEKIKNKTNVSLNNIDIFYTYLTMQNEFAELIINKAKKGSLFLVYGLGKILPKYNGLQLLTPDSPLENILAVYQKN